MASHPVIERYVADLSTGYFPTARRSRTAVLMRSATACSKGSDAHRVATDDPALAARRAVDEHGPADLIASAYAPSRCDGPNPASPACSPWASSRPWPSSGTRRCRPGPPSHGIPTARRPCTRRHSDRHWCLPRPSRASTAALLGTGRLPATFGDHLLGYRIAI